jgi:YD repeat-containing protein
LGADIEAAYDPFGDLVSLASGDWNAGFKRYEMGLEIERLLPGNLRKQTERDRLGRITGQNILHGYTNIDKKSYLWGVNDRLLSVIDNGKERQYEYDGKGYLTRTFFEDGTQELRCPDRSGNLYESLDRKDRKYARGGQLVKTKEWEYKYDEFGNLVRKKKQWGETWRYRWNAAGMLASVTRPDSREVQFKYDALGRRIEKRFGHTITRWVWDGNVPLHEWKENWRRDYEPDKGEFWDITKQPLVTWVFEAGTFVPAAKITEQTKLSIVANYMGTPEAMYREDGAKVWTCELNSYGKVRNFQGQYKTDCPFRYQGQYEDGETGLYYNRFGITRRRKGFILVKTQ